MFSIDLLKGRGIPEKSGPEKMAIAVATFALPIVIALFVVGSFLTSKIRIAVREGEIKSLEAKISSASFEEAVKNQMALEQKKQSLNGSLSEVASSISKHTQWSAVLEVIIQNIPQTLILKNVEVREESRKLTSVKTENGEKKTDKTVSVRVLHLSLVAMTTGNYDKDVRTFRDALMADSNLAPRLDDVRVSQEVGKINDKNVISYEIYLVFKPTV